MGKIGPQNVFLQNFFLKSDKIFENHVCKCLGFFFSLVKFDTIEKHLKPFYKIVHPINIDKHPLTQPKTVTTTCAKSNNYLVGYHFLLVYIFIQKQSFYQQVQPTLSQHTGNRPICTKPKLLARDTYSHGTCLSQPDSSQNRAKLILPKNKKKQLKSEKVRLPSGWCVIFKSKAVVCDALSIPQKNWVKHARGAVDII